jgi:hypothetical protein
MRNPLDGPRAGTRAYLALRKLYDTGGGATAADWLKALGWDMSLHMFHHEIRHLTIRRQAFLRDQVFFISDDGKKRLGEPLDATPSVQLTLVAPPYTQPWRPMAASGKPRLQAMREGAFDYMSIPSLQGDARVAHKTALVVDQKA